MIAVPYLREVVVSGELAKLAFDYLKANTPQSSKDEASTAWNVSVQGRVAAFKAWCVSAWTQESYLELAVGDYLDYLAMYSDTDKTQKPTLAQYYEAVRAPEGRGTFKDFSKIITRMGQVPDKKNYIKIRQTGRNSEEGWAKKLSGMGYKLGK